MTKVTTHNLQLVATNEVTLLATGAYNPITPAHLMMMDAAQAAVQADPTAPKTAARALLSPSQDMYLAAKTYDPLALNGQMFPRPKLSAAHRLEFAERVIAEYKRHVQSSQLEFATSDYESKVTGHFIDHGPVAKALGRTVGPIAYVAGSDLFDKCCHAGCHGMACLRVEREALDQCISSSRVMACDPDMIALMDRDFPWYYPCLIEFLKQQPELEPLGLAMEVEWRKVVEFKANAVNSFIQEQLTELNAMVEAKRAVYERDIANGYKMKSIADWRNELDAAGDLQVALGDLLCHPAGFADTAWKENFLPEELQNRVAAILRRNEALHQGWLVKHSQGVKKHFKSKLERFTENLVKAIPTRLAMIDAEYAVMTAPKVSAPEKGCAVM